MAVVGLIIVTMNKIRIIIAMTKEKPNAHMILTPTENASQIHN